MRNIRMENSLRSLTSLYTVVIGVALSSSIVELVDSEVGLSSLTTPSVLLFLSFIFTLFPFYHGAIRHLDDAYLENEGNHIKDGALILDFLLLFFHGIAFVFLSLMLSNPGDFAVILMGILFLDVIWGIFAHFGSSSRESAAEWKWTIINAVALMLSVTLIVMTDTNLLDFEDSLSEKFAWIIFMLSLSRTFVDYAWGWKFYFPISD